MTSTTFDRFDICEAAMFFADHYNVGGFTALPTDKRRRDIAGRLSRMGFRPAPCLTFEGEHGLTENSRAYYDRWAAMEEAADIARRVRFYNGPEVSY